MSHEILKYFLKLGATGFGGPLSLIQQMRQDLVLEQKKIATDDFDQAFTLIKAMPGPIAFQMAVFCGQRLGRFWGGLAAGFGILFPAFLMMIAIGMSYEKFNHNPWVEAILRGMQFSVAAVILFSLKSFFLTYKDRFVFWLVLIMCFFLFYFEYAPESILIIGFGLVMIIGRKTAQLTKTSVAVASFFVIDWENIWHLFRTCFTAGALIFGTGLAAFPFLQSAFVDQLRLLDLNTFNDAVSFGQMTPGPVTISATFLGYKIAFIPGAIAATIGLYLPPFFHMSTWFPRALSWFSKQKWVTDFILGATSAVVGCILVTVIRMNKAEFGHWRFWLVFLLSSVILFVRPKTPVLALIIGMGLFHLLVVFTT